MANWQNKNITDVALIGDGNHSSNYPKNSEMVLEGIPFIRATNMVKGKVVWQNMKFIDEKKHIKLKKGHLKSGDILFTNRGEIGKIAIVGNDFSEANLNSQIAWFRCLDNLNNKFLFYFLLSPSMVRHYSTEKNGTALQQFTIKQINALKIPTPSLPKQQAIVDKLNFAFDAIEKAKANIEKNIENAKELFQSKLNEIFSQKGEGWEEKKLKDVCSYSKIKNVKNLPYIGLEHIKANTGEFIGSMEPFKVKSVTFYFNDKVLLYGRLRPYLNKVFLPCFEGHCSTEIFPVLPNEKYIDRGFLFFWFFSENINKKINDSCTGARMPRANMNEVLNFDINFPSSLKTQREIFSQMENLSELTNILQEKYKQKLANLEELKKSILEKAFKGELV